MAIGGVVSWFPQEYAALLFAFKATVGLLAVIMLIYHMTQNWPGKKTFAQRLRYLTLLAYAVLVTGASGEQISESDLVSYRHIGSTVVTIMLVIAMAYSIREEGTDGHRSEGSR